MSTLLQAAQLEQFHRDGYTLLQGAFSPDDAAQAREVLWSRVEREGARRDDPQTWTQPLVHLKETFGDGPFARAWTPRLRGALDELLGAGRYNQPGALGWWPVAFPGFSKKWRPPTTGWHVDGIQFHHRLTSPDQGLLPLFFFSDVRATDGGTAISVGSHRVAARVLHEAGPDGLSVHELSRRVKAHIGDVPATAVELTGKAGDVALLHPFMLHARSPKVGGEVRFICNPCVSLRAPMNMSGGVAASPVERAIFDALKEISPSDQVTVGARA